MIWFILTLPLLALVVAAAFMLAWRFLPVVVGLAVYVFSGHDGPFAIAAMVLVYLIQRQRARSSSRAELPAFARQERRRGLMLEVGSGSWMSARPRRERVPAAPRPARKVAGSVSAGPGLTGSVTVPEAPAPDALSGAVEALLRRDGARLPAEARASVVRIRERVAEAALLLGDGSGGTTGSAGTTGGGGPVSEGALLTRQVALTYLPDTLAAYLRLPRSQADAAPLLDGKTGRQLLAEQLAMLEGALADVVARAVQGEGQGLLHQQRFLEARLRGRKGDFEV